ncbi:hypothetical protein ScPMuIL_013398 [Solemya velum]
MLDCLRNIFFEMEPCQLALSCDDGTHSLLFRQADGSYCMIPTVQAQSSGSSASRNDQMTTISTTPNNTKGVLLQPQTSNVMNPLTGGMNLVKPVPVAKGDTGIVSCTPGILLKRGKGDGIVTVTAGALVSPPASATDMADAKLPKDRTCFNPVARKSGKQYATVDNSELEMMDPDECYYAVTADTGTIQGEQKEMSDYRNISVELGSNIIARSNTRKSRNDLEKTRIITSENMLIGNGKSISIQSCLESQSSSPDNIVNLVDYDSSSENENLEKARPVMLFSHERAANVSGTFTTKNLSYPEDRQLGIQSCHDIQISCIKDSTAMKQTCVSQRTKTQATSGMSNRDISQSDYGKTVILSGGKSISRREDVTVIPTTNGNPVASPPSYIYFLPPNKSIAPSDKSKPYSISEVMYPATMVAEVSDVTSSNMPSILTKTDGTCSSPANRPLMNCLNASLSSTTMVNTTTPLLVITPHSQTVVSKPLGHSSKVVVRPPVTVNLTPEAFQKMIACQTQIANPQPLQTRNPPISIVPAQPTFPFHSFKMHSDQSLFAATTSLPLTKTFPTLNSQLAGGTCRSLLTVNRMHGSQTESQKCLQTGTPQLTSFTVSNKLVNSQKSLSMVNSVLEPTSGELGNINGASAVMSCNSQQPIFIQFGNTPNLNTSVNSGSLKQTVTKTILTGSSVISGSHAPSVNSFDAINQPGMNVVYVTTNTPVTTTMLQSPIIVTPPEADSVKESITVKCSPANSNRQTLPITTSFGNIPQQSSSSLAPQAYVPVSRSTVFTNTVNSVPIQLWNGKNLKLPLPNPLKPTTTRAVSSVSCMTTQSNQANPSPHILNSNPVQVLTQAFSSEVQSSAPSVAGQTVSAKNAMYLMVPTTTHNNTTLLPASGNIPIMSTQINDKTTSMTSQSQSLTEQERPTAMQIDILTSHEKTSVTNVEPNTRTPILILPLRIKPNRLPTVQRNKINTNARNVQQQKNPETSIPTQNVQPDKFSSRSGATDVSPGFKLVNEILQKCSSTHLNSEIVPSGKYFQTFPSYSKHSQLAPVTPLPLVIKKETVSKANVKTEAKSYPLYSIPKSKNCFVSSNAGPNDTLCSAMVQPEGVSSSTRVSSPENLVLATDSCNRYNDSFESRPCDSRFINLLVENREVVSEMGSVIPDSFNNSPREKPRILKKRKQGMTETAKYCCSITVACDSLVNGDAKTISSELGSSSPSTNMWKPVSTGVIDSKTFDTMESDGGAYDIRIGSVFSLTDQNADDFGSEVKTTKNSQNENQRIQKTKTHDCAMSYKRKRCQKSRRRSLHKFQDVGKRRVSRDRVKENSVTVGPQGTEELRCRPCTVALHTLSIMRSVIDAREMDTISRQCSQLCRQLSVSKMLLKKRTEKSFVTALNECFGDKKPRYEIFDPKTLLVSKEELFGQRRSRRLKVVNTSRESSPPMEPIRTRFTENKSSIHQNLPLTVDSNTQVHDRTCIESKHAVARTPKLLLENTSGMSKKPDVKSGEIKIFSEHQQVGMKSNDASIPEMGISSGITKSKFLPEKATRFESKKRKLRRIGEKKKHAGIDVPENSECEERKPSKYFVNIKTETQMPKICNEEVFKDVICPSMLVETCTVQQNLNHHSYLEKETSSKSVVGRKFRQDCNKKQRKRQKQIKKPVKTETLEKDLSIDFTNSTVPAETCVHQKDVGNINTDYMHITGDISSDRLRRLPNTPRSVVKGDAINGKRCVVFQVGDNNFIVPVTSGSESAPPRAFFLDFDKKMSGETKKTTTDVSGQSSCLGVAKIKVEADKTHMQPVLLDDNHGAQEERIRRLKEMLLEKEKLVQNLKIKKET